MIRLAKLIYKSLLDNMCKQHLVFHHVPKCAGTSVGKAFPMRYLLSRGIIEGEKALHVEVESIELLSVKEIVQKISYINLYLETIFH